MGKNEIRLRRQRISSGRIAQHRNYGDIMARHEKDLRIKRILRIFTYFLIITIVVLLFFMVKQIEKKKVSRSKTAQHSVTAAPRDVISENI
jgi:hypothetical protein